MSMSNSNAIGDWIRQLKEVDILDVADRLGIKRQGSTGIWFSPARAEKTPSLSLYGGTKWMDHTSGDGGSTIDLIIYAGVADDFMAAAKLLGEWVGKPIPKPDTNGHVAPVKLSRAEYLASVCAKNPESAVEYLTGRGISVEVARAAIKNKTVGFNDYTSPSKPACTPGHGGAAVAFMVYNNGRAVAVDFRYVDPELNGGVKTQCQGEKTGAIWISNRARFKQAKKVYIVESPINALSFETVNSNPYHVAIAIRGVANVDMDWSFMRGKTAIIALDMADGINKSTGKRAGMEAAYKLYDRLTAADVAARMVDMTAWTEGEDLNDVLQLNNGTVELARRLKILDPWLITGQPSYEGNDLFRNEARKRIFLPSQDYMVYWRYRVMDDFMQYVDDFKNITDEAGDTTGRQEFFGDLCSFRVAQLSRLSIQSHLATVNGTPDSQAEVVFGISCQTPRNGALLQRDVVTGDKIYNLEWWKYRFGHIWKPAQFARMITIMERSADLAARDVVNFIGVAWQDGKLKALEGQNCFFTEPQKQCLYYNMTFPRGAATQARQVVQAYQSTFKENAAAIALTWILGAHLKNVIGFYPHFQMQAEKGSGKSKLLESLQAACAFQVLSGQMLKTDHRRRASVSYTTHPVGWDEFSKLPKQVLSDIDALLQSTYRFEFTRIGSALTPYLMCAPVLLAGEEVDVQSLQSKICRSTLSVAKQGDIISHNLPQFPMWAWLQFIAAADPARIRETHAGYTKLCQVRSRTGDGDATAHRMMENYAGIMTAWAMLAEFAEFDVDQGGLIEDLITEMNQHMADTDGARLPWVWIMEILLSELDAKRFDYPFCWDYIVNDDGEREMALFIRANHVMDHISTANHLRDKFNHLPIKTGRIFKRQLLQSNVVIKDDVEKSIRAQRTAHLTAISLSQLEKLGLYATPRVE